MGLRIETLEQAAELEGAGDIESRLRREPETTMVVVGPLREAVVLWTGEAEIELAPGWSGAVARDSAGRVYPVTQEVLDSSYVASDAPAARED